MSELHLMGLPAWALWILIAILAGLFEVWLPSFVFSFVCLAALVASACAVPFGWEVQLIVFSAALLSSILVLRPILLRKFKKIHHLPSRSQVLLGRRGSVTEAIDPSHQLGRVNIIGQDWSAKSEETLAVGAEIEVVGADGIILIVKEV